MSPSLVIIGILICHGNFSVRILLVSMVRSFTPIIYLFLCLFLMSRNPTVGLFKSVNRVVLKQCRF